MTSSVEITGERPVSNRALRTAALDIVLVVGTLLVAKYALLSVEAMWTYAGPISLVLALAVASLRLRQGGETWASLGLGRPPSWRKTLAWTLVATALTLVAGTLVEGLVNAAIGDGAAPAPPRNGGRFADVAGSPAAFAYWLAVAWVIGGFTEEMLFRGFLIRRFEALFSQVPYGLILAVIFPAVLFGQQHFYYQGLSGAVATGVLALISGLLYLFFRRNLWPLTLSHGLANSIGLTLIYAAVQPGG